MLGYGEFIALDDLCLNTKYGKHVFTRGRVYYGRFNYNDVLIYDNNDQAIRLEYCHSCFRMNVSYTNYFKEIVRKAAENGREFYKIRTGK